MANATIQQGGVFRILVSQHVGPGPEGCTCIPCTSGRRKNHVYRARRKGDPEDFIGDIIESEIDLCARFNAPPPFEQKYERLG